jgi:hypothetical protein
MILIRLFKHAIELKKPVMLLNVGPTRADGLPGLVKLDVRSGAILRDVARAVMYGLKSILCYQSLIYFLQHSVVLERKMIP